MRATEEQALLVRLWQEVQDAVVAADARRLDRIAAEARRRAAEADAAGEWSVLAEEADRHVAQLRAWTSEEPAAAPVEPADAEATDGPRPRPAGDDYPTEAGEVDGGAEAGDAPGSRRSQLVRLAWLVLVLAYVAFQLIWSGD